MRVIKQSKHYITPPCCSLWEKLYFRAAAAAAKSRQSYPTLCDPIDGSPPGSRLWDSPGKNTGVDCHFLLQCMKVKSESEVAQLCPTLCDPRDCSPPGSSIHGTFQARVLEWIAIAFSDFRTRLALRPKMRTCKFRHASREHSGASLKNKKSPSQVEWRLMSIFTEERHHLSKCYHLGMKNTRGTLLGLLS